MTKPLVRKRNSPCTLKVQAVYWRYGFFVDKFLIADFSVNKADMDASSSAVSSDDRVKILGVWRLLSFEVESQATGERESVLGKDPTGYLIFTPEGRFMAVLTGGCRKAPKTDQDQADLMKSMCAYTGMCRFEGDRWITEVDVSWHPAWVGTEQARSFRLDEDRLHVIGAWGPSLDRPERGISRGILTFERANSDVALNRMLRGRT